MQKWEYQVMPTGTSINYASLRTVLNEQGKEGWELVATTTIDNQLHCIFKRPAQ
jgi:hypothetical protein